jgi:ParB-like chromosome segregation protein Spo0J
MRNQKNGVPRRGSDNGTPTVDAVEQKPSNKSSQADIKLLPFHPLADMFPLLEGKDFDDLVEDIKKNGLREKIDLYQGKIADGRNRYRALLRLGVDPSVEPDKYFRKAIYTHTIGGEIAPHEQTNDDRVRAYIISRNIHRRHLTAEQKRDLIAKLLIADPGKSDRLVAKQAGVSNTHVGKLRKELEKSGDVSTVDTRTDTKGRKQPARKASKPKPKDPLVINPIPLRFGVSVEPTGSAAGLGDDKPPVEAEIVQQPSASKPEPEKDWKVEMRETTALIDFAKFTIANIESGHLKISGDPERYRKWCDLKDRVAPLVKV